MKDFCYDEKPKQAMFINNFDPAAVTFSDYITQKSLPQVKELVSNYKLSEIWLDTPIYTPPDFSFRFYTTIYEANPEILVSQRIGNEFGDIGTPGDNVIPDEASENTWEGIATTNNSWGFKSYDKDWKSPQETLFWLLENVSKGGNFLLNVGPDGSGLIPKQSVDNLLAVGRWLKVNGDAIYGTKPWAITHEGPAGISIKGTEHRSKYGFQLDVTSEDFWFTKKGDKLYVIGMVWPGSGTAKVRSLNDYAFSDIKLLGSAKKISWRKESDVIEVDLPEIESKELGYALELIR
jgi:alpha-L-fucosidase